MKIIESHIVPAIPEKMRLQEYAVSIFNTIPSKSSLKKAIKKGLILIDGKTSTTGDWIKQGQKIQLLQESSKRKIFKLKVEVLHEDEYMAVVIKPSGLPTSGNYFRTLENALPFNLKQSEERDALKQALPAHRLDRPTSGLIICGKNKKTLIALQQAFSEKKIQKTYHALVKGKLENSIEVSTPIGGKPAQSEIIPINWYKISEANYTLVKLIPFTGRTHQLRIHLEQTGYPIVGDLEYGKEEKGILKGRSLFLFATGLDFKHPVNGEKICLKFRLPKKLRNLDRYRQP